VIFFLLGGCCKGWFNVIYGLRPFLQKKEMNEQTGTIPVSNCGSYSESCRQNHMVQPPL
jgi:hypothetical protein